MVQMFTLDDNCKQTEMNKQILRSTRRSLVIDCCLYEWFIVSNWLCQAVVNTRQQLLIKYDDE